MFYLTLAGALQDFSKCMHHFLNTQPTPPPPHPTPYNNVFMLHTSSLNWAIDIIFALFPAFSLNISLHQQITCFFSENRHSGVKKKKLLCFTKKIFQRIKQAELNELRNIVLCWFIFSVLDNSLYICIILRRSTFFCEDRLFPHTRVRIASHVVVLKGSSRVPGAGTRDAWLRTSAWEANVRTVRTGSYAPG